MLALCAIATILSASPAAGLRPDPMRMEMAELADPMRAEMAHIVDADAISTLSGQATDKAEAQEEKLKAIKKKANVAKASIEAVPKGAEKSHAAAVDAEYKETKEKAEELKELRDELLARQAKSASVPKVMNKVPSPEATMEEPEEGKKGEKKPCAEPQSDIVQIHPPPKGKQVTSGLKASASKGDTKIVVSHAGGFTLGKAIHLNPGTLSQEDVHVVGFIPTTNDEESAGELILALPLVMDHKPGEVLVQDTRAAVVITEQVFPEHAQDVADMLPPPGSDVEDTHQWRGSHEFDGHAAPAEPADVERRYKTIPHIPIGAGRTVSKWPNKVPIPGYNKVKCEATARPALNNTPPSPPAAEPCPDCPPTECFGNISIGVKVPNWLLFTFNISKICTGDGTRKMVQYYSGLYWKDIKIRLGNITIKHNMTIGPYMFHTLDPSKGPKTKVLRVMSTCPCVGDDTWGNVGPWGEANGKDGDGPFEKGPPKLPGGKPPSRCTVSKGEAPKSLPYLNTVKGDVIKLVDFEPTDKWAIKHKAWFYDNSVDEGPLLSNAKPDPFAKAPHKIVLDDAEETTKAKYAAEVKEFYMVGYQIPKKMQKAEPHKVKALNATSQLGLFDVTKTSCGEFFFPGSSAKWGAGGKLGKLKKKALPNPRNQLMSLDKCLGDAKTIKHGQSPDEDVIMVEVTDIPSGEDVGFCSPPYFTGAEVKLEIGSRSGIQWQSIELMYDELDEETGEKVEVPMEDGVSLVEAGFLRSAKFRFKQGKIGLREELEEIPEHLRVSDEMSEAEMGDPSKGKGEPAPNDATLEYYDHLPGNHKSGPHAEGKGKGKGKGKEGQQEEPKDRVRFASVGARSRSKAASRAKRGAAH